MCTRVQVNMQSDDVQVKGFVSTCAQQENGAQSRQIGSDAVAAPKIADGVSTLGRAGSRAFGGVSSSLPKPMKLLLLARDDRLVGPCPSSSESSSSELAAAPSAMSWSTSMTTSGRRALPANVEGACSDLRISLLVISSRRT